MSPGWSGVGSGSIDIEEGFVTVVDARCRAGTTRQMKLTSVRIVEPNPLGGAFYLGSPVHPSSQEVVSRGGQPLAGGRAGGWSEGNRGGEPNLALGD